MNIKRMLFFFMALTVIITSAFANKSDYEKAWDAFLKNDRAEARKLFNSALEDNLKSGDALLSLTLMDWLDGKYEQGFDHFSQYYFNNSSPYAAFYAVSSLPIIRESRGYTSSKKVEFFEKMLADPDLNGTLRAMVNEALGSYYRAVHNDKKAADYFKKMGTINKWQVLGTFDNTSGSGFVKDWGAVAKAKKTDVFQNKVKANVSWYTPAANRANNWFAFDNYFTFDNAVMYAQSFVTSPVDQDVYMRVGTSGSLKVWINDVLEAVVLEERNCDLDIYGYKVHLQKGVNRVLVQIGQSEIYSANFMLRFTDENANPIAGLTETSEYTDYKAASPKNTDPKVLPFYPEEQLQQKIASEPDNELYPVLLAQAYLRNDKAFEATVVLKELENKYPQSTIVSYSLLEAYARARNQTDRSREVENIKKNDPESYVGLQMTYSDAIQQERYTDAEGVLKKIIELYGDNEYTDEAKIYMASYQKRIPELYDLAQKMNAKYPYSWNYTELCYYIEKNKSTNPKTALSILEKFTKKYFEPEALSALASAYFEHGNVSKGIATLKILQDKEPDDIDHISMLSNVMYQMQNYQEALRYNDKLLQQAPYTSYIYNSRAYIYKNMNNTELAKENFRKAIYYGPTSYDSRAQLRLLEDKKELYELFPKSNLTEIIKNAPTTIDYPQDNSVIILNGEQMIVYPENAKEYRQELAVKILTYSGVEEWKEYTIPYYASQKLIIDKAEVIKANGTIVKAENNDNYVVFTNLEVNDVLHLEYRIQDYYSGKIAEHFSTNFKYNFDVPAINNKFSLLVPKNKKFDYKVVNGSIEPAVTDIEDMKLYSWELDNQPAINTEPYMSSYNDITTQLFVSSFPDWGYISDWYKDLTHSKFTPDYVFKDTYNSLLKGKENLSDLEKAKIFYNYILENITYSSVNFMQSNLIPQKPSRTITTRLGDCKDLSTLFVALCREAGIKANLVLIATRDYGNNKLVLPSINFNHCIAQLNIGNDVYYLELTDNNLPFGAAIDADLNAQILPIPFSNEPFGDKLIRMEIPNRPQNTSYRTQNIKLNGNNMSIYRKSDYVAALASQRRYQFKSIGSEQQNKIISERISSAFNKPLKVSDLRFANLENLSDTVSQAYSFEVINALQDVAGMKIFALPWSDINSLDLVSSETRKYPLEYWAYQTEDVTTEKITIELPAGKKLVDTPKNIDLQCANASYKMIFNTSKQGVVEVTRIFTRKKDQITPAEYPEYRTFLNEITENDTKQYAIK